MTDLSVWADEDRPVRHRRRKKKRDRKGGLAVVISLLVILAVVAGGYAVVKGVGGKLTDALSTSADDYPGPGEGEVVIEVTPGQTVAEVGRTLKKEDVVASVDAFLAAANAEPRSSSFSPASTRSSARCRPARRWPCCSTPSRGSRPRSSCPKGSGSTRRSSGWPRAPSSRSPTTRRRSRTPARWVCRPTRRRTPRASCSRRPTTFRRTPPRRTCSSRCSRYADAAETTGVERTERSPYELVIIASLVEAEARHPEDFGKVARVVYNRLEQGCRCSSTPPSTTRSRPTRSSSPRGPRHRLAVQHLQEHRPAARAHQLSR